MELIVAEKPRVAQKIASALSKKAVRKSFNKVSYYVLEDIDSVIVPAVGHIFGLVQKGKERGYPVFDVEWKPSHEVNKKSYYVKAYIDTLRYFGERAETFVSACDYDVEGSLIAFNVMRHLFHGREGYRMKFSTVTPYDLKEAYENMGAFDYLNAYAGEARHIVDWYYGINVSRALMSAVRSAGMNLIMSTGRVQGPTLSFVMERELQIRNFVPREYYTIHAEAKGSSFDYARNPVWEKEEADKLFEKVGKTGMIVKVEDKEVRYRAPPAFDLTTLQTEAYKVHKISPTQTLSIAQALYENGLISYPRTSSQKLPPSLNLKFILGKLAEAGDYKEEARKILEKGEFRPRQGAKEDPAHPAIHPTGFTGQMKAEEKKVYDLITRRFLSAFMDDEVVAERMVSMEAGIEFIGKGARVIERGWNSVYPYYKVEEKAMADFKEGEEVEVKKSRKKGKTKPPARYNQASLVKEMEKKQIGTKSTRAVVVSTLYLRKYIIGAQVKVTPLGEAVYSAIEDYVPDLISENMTRRLEQDIEAIQAGKKTKDEVVQEAREVLEPLLLEFKKKEKEIGKEIVEKIRAPQKV
ncbi:MAG: DNA topoisomerase I [Candidatus Anstonellales archaeon]